jgi:hypothetical protein
MGFWGSQSSLGVFIFFGIHGIHDVYYGGSSAFHDLAIDGVRCLVVDHRYVTSRLAGRAEIF